MIGEMRYRIILNNPQRISNGRGGWRLDYETGDRMEVWAAATVTTIAAAARYARMDESIDMLFLVRANPFITKDTKILFNSDEFGIVNFAPTENPHFWEIAARGWAA